MPLIRTKIVDPPAVPPQDENEPPVGEAIQVVLRLGKWEFHQLIRNRIDDDSKARLEENGYRFGLRLQKWWKLSAPEPVS